MIARCDGVVSRVQIDIIDGVFANNKTVEPDNLKNMPVSLGLDFHLMTDNPANWIEKCVEAGADRIIGQIEMMPSQEEFISQVQLKNLRVGLAIDLTTHVSKLDRNLLARVDVVLIMSVKAGLGGQKFDQSALRKIAELNGIRTRDKIPYRICVDGGEYEDVIDDTYFRGADEVVIGKRLFKGNLEDNIKKMKEAAIK